jgi:hypothetical protein
MTSRGLGPIEVIGEDQPLAGWATVQKHGGPPHPEWGPRKDAEPTPPKTPS